MITRQAKIGLHIRRAGVVGAATARHEIEALEESALLLTVATSQSHPAEREGDAGENFSWPRKARTRGML